MSFIPFLRQGCRSNHGNDAQIQHNLKLGNIPNALRAHEWPLSRSIFLGVSEQSRRIRGFDFMLDLRAYISFQRHDKQS
jgi:hypothetical protein